MGISGALGLRLFAATLLAGLLSGCALPPAVVIASYVIDAGSFVATGKTATDHGISAVAQQDCALLRVFEGSICTEEQNYQYADAGVLIPLTPEGQLGMPMPITPLAAVGTVEAVERPMLISPLLGADTASLPQIVSLPDARYGGFSGYYASRTITRDALLSGATYLAEGLSYVSLGNES